MKKDLADLLEKKYAFFNHPRFIEHDPIQIPHQFSDVKNKEIMGFWVAMLSWGQRKTILNNAKTLIQLMDGDPFDFIMHHQEKDLQRFDGFKHRTFQFTDTLYFIDFFKRHYNCYESLESAFLLNHQKENTNIKESLIGFHCGLWKNIDPVQVICPLDIHSQTTAEKLGLIRPGPANWKKAEELTFELKKLDPKDPVKYDFALYGMGIENKTIWT